MKDTLDKYIGTRIGANVDRILKIDSVEVLAVNETYFCTKSLSTGNTYYIPYTNVLKIIENDDGIEVRRFFSENDKFRAVIKIGHSHSQNIA